MSTLEPLDRMTVPGTLYESLPDGAVRCHACAHHCLIRPGRRGICQVRFNEDRVLKVPWGYVAALQSDPIEKKPFFHVYPGQDALTFGMLGCDMHCGFCFVGDTIVITDQGPISFAEAFTSASRHEQHPGAEIAYPSNLKAVTSRGGYQPVRAIFKHPYQGKMVTIRPYYLPPIHCTVDHRVYATSDINQLPERIPAQQLTSQSYLAIPRHYTGSFPQVIRTSDLFSRHRVSHRVSWELTPAQREEILTATQKGVTSREIGLTLGRSASYIRHVRSRLAHGRGLDIYTHSAVIENERIRFPKEHRPGIPIEVPLDEDLARLLGYYCAEGSIVENQKRPNSLVLNFSFSLEESRQADEVVELLAKTLGVKARLVEGPTTLRASTGKTSAALFFKYLAGKGAQGKFIPPELYNAPPEVIQAFVNAYIDGDGHRYDNGKVNATTVSRQLAYGLCQLVLKLGYLASIYEKQMPAKTTIQGRIVNRAPRQYSVVWYLRDPENRRCLKNDDYYLIPIRSLSINEYEGDVYNMEVDVEHNYLANFCLVSNCQNWLTSQTGRDEESNVSVQLAQRVTPEELIRYARRMGSGVVASSYNEPLITTEWAVSVFQEAKKAGLPCVYISNGNVTPEALDLLSPYLSAYKIDLKSMQDKHYRQLGAVLKNILDGIKLVHDRGLWLEIVTLVIPGFNDDPAELWDAARFIASVSRDIPWHITAFHPDYKMTDPDATGPKTLLKAAEIGQEAGLNYVYAGNLPGYVDNLENTICPNCGTTLIERYGYALLDYRITAGGKCPDCGTKIPGVWTTQPETVRLNGLGMPRRVIRRW